MILVFNFEFSSAHFYEQKKWTPEKNQMIFGRCYTPHGHGHNYRLELEVDIGDSDPKSAKITIEPLIKNVVNKLDHEHLNFVIQHFKETVPTTENISLYLKEQIRIPQPFQMNILRLFEMNSIFVELKI